MKLFYIRTPEDTPAVVEIDGNESRIWKTGVKPYSMQFHATNYLRAIAEGTVRLRANPDEIVMKEPGESDESFEERLVGEAEHVACFERIFPKDQKEALAHPKTFHKCLDLFPPLVVWYETAKEAKRDADGMETVYIGPVEVYDPAEIERIEKEIASYPNF